MRSILSVLLVGVALTGCAGMNEKLSRVGVPPAQTAMTGANMPMPVPTIETRQANSLWSSGRQTFFKDQRARTIGDILTVVVEIDDKAELANETKRDRTSSEEGGVTGFFGLEQYAASKILPDGADLAALGQFGSTTATNGKGEVDREEKIELQLATVITSVLPNGNMVINGRQEVRVNFENRILNLAGVIRPEDISIDNTISYEKIAEARISYGGTGQITDLQQPRYGQQIYDAVSPF